MESVTMSDGRNIPLLGYGTWQIPSEQIPQALGDALEAGYRHIDTAHNYDNEQAIGDVLKEHFSKGKLKREDVFVSTKLWAIYMAPDDVRGAVEGSLRKLQLDYVDLMLIHMPFSFKNLGDDTRFPVDEHGNHALTHDDFVVTYQELEKFVSEGKIRSLGVSNFNSRQVERVYSAATVKPVVNQVECHAYLPQAELQQYCEQRGVLLEAYAALGSPGRMEILKPTEKERELLDEPVLKTIGAKYGKTPAQVLIKSLLQRGIVTIVKSSTPSRIKENSQVFDFSLSAEDMAAIGKLRSDHRYFSLHFIKGLATHPENPFNIPF